MKSIYKNSFLVFSRNLKTAVNAINSNDKIKSFDETPGPRGSFGIGTFYNYLPYVGKYHQCTLLNMGLEKYKKWGELVREKMLPGIDIVWVFNPNDISIIFNDTGPDAYPQRRSHLALEQYRKDRPHLYKNGGLLPTNGPEWWRLRSQLQKGLSSPQNIKNFLSQCDAITIEFIENIANQYLDVKDKSTNESPMVNSDFLLELSRLNLELLCSVVFNIRMNSFTVEERKCDSRSSKLIESAEITNNCILPTDQGLPIWKFIETSTYKQLRLAQEYMESVAIDLISKTKSINKSDETSVKCLLNIYLENAQLDSRDIVGMIADLLLAGIDTTSYTTSFLLYHIAKNPAVQQKLFEECKRLLPNSKQSITPANLNNQATYARAVLKETLRINPISVGVGRNANSDLILSGYRIPKGTVLVTQNMISCRLEKYFVEPDKFLPERWLKCNTIDNRADPIHPYLVLPFGHGMRACIARRLAEQNILLLMIRLIRTYEIEWVGAPFLNVQRSLINKPDQPMKFLFKKRSL